MRIYKYIYLLLIFLVVMLSSCSKEDSYDALYSDSGFSSVAVFNAIPNSQGVTLSIGEGVSQKTIVTASDKLVFGSYVNYKNWFSGDFDVSIQNKTMSESQNAKKRIALKSGTFYSLFLYRKNDIEYVLTEDNVIRPADGKVKMRIAHFCADLSNVRLIDSENKSLFNQDISFGTVTSFVEISTSDLSKLIVQSTDGRLRGLVNEEFQIENKGMYTLLIKESLKGTNEDFLDWIELIKQ